MPSVRVYQPRKTAMQSGLAGTRGWVVEFEPGGPRASDPLMGWAGGGDTRGQVRMRFGTREEALAFCERQGLDAQVIEPKRRKPSARGYADNFRFDRGANWTH